MHGPFGPGTIVLGGGSLLLAIGLLIGFLLPGTWEAQASMAIQATPVELQSYLDSPEGWQEWTTWPDSGLVRSGPDRGAGAKISWNDDELGSGSLTIGGVMEGRSVEYSVEVEGAGGAIMRTHGVVTLTPTAQGVDVVWHEDGDLGRNPLMGFWALSMERAQSTEMAKGLDRLSSLATDSVRSSPPG
jgi:hypothetical protein